MKNNFLILIVSLFTLFTQILISQSKYYVSNTTGNDINNGSINSPWKTLQKISNQNLKSGDCVYFKKGDVFKGHFVVNGSGTLENPIVITSYGSGNQPILTGQVGAENGGDYQEAIYVLNNDHIHFEDLEIQNERLINREGVDEEIAYGLHIENKGNRNLKNFKVKNVTVKNVYAPKPVLDKNAFDGLEVAGIRFFSGWNSLNNQRNIQDIVVEDCYFTNLQRFGIHFKQGGHSNNTTDDFLNRIANVVCRNNTFYYLGGTSILPQRTYNCLIENNLFDHPGASTDSRMPGRGSSVWTFHCINTIIQHNKCLSTRGYFDSHGIHIDHENVNTFIQYNYMEDCEGGFVEILKGNKNAVYRFNVSINDGWRNGGGPIGAWENSNHTLWISKNTNPDGVENPLLSENNYIYNNTIVLDYNNIDDSNKKETTAIEIIAKSTYIFNNIFYSINGGKMGKQNVKVNITDGELFIKNNLYFGDVDNRFITLDANPILGNPNFTGSGNYQEKFDINNNSLAIDKGTTKTGPPIPGAGTGIFKNLTAYPTVDFYGNPIDLSKGTPNIGASNKKQNLKADNSTENNPEWSIRPNPTKSRIYIHNTSLDTEKIDIHITDATGKTISEIKNLLRTDSKMFVINLHNNLTNGFYHLSIKDNSDSIHKKLIINK